MPTTQRPHGAYNPLDKHNLGTNVADALLARPVVSLPPPAFPGAGVYAIYYTGSFVLAETPGSGDS